MEKEIVYLATNIVEANMIIQFLEGHKIAAYVVEKEDSEKLGMQRPIGLVPIEVKVEDSEEAIAKIRYWKEDSDTKRIANSVPSKPKYRYILLGFIIGVVLTNIHYKRSYNFNNTIDQESQNSDGFYYDGTKIDRFENDLNGDGKIDEITYYNYEGQPKNVKSDYNFNGTFDTFSFYSGGMLSHMEVDANEDGNIDLRHYYKKRFWYKTEYYKKGKVFKIETTDGLITKEAKVDTDNDGILNKTIRYDYLLEEIE